MLKDRIIDNSAHFIKKLLDLGIHPILANSDKENLSGIVSFRHEKSMKILEELQEKGNLLFGKRRYGSAITAFLQHEGRN